jgi:hypothetical protein
MVAGWRRGSSTSRSLRLDLASVLQKKKEAAAPEGRRFVVAYTSSMPWFFSGIERVRLPVALKNALSTAGAGLTA